jgi:hypothetical protein
MVPYAQAYPPVFEDMERRGLGLSQLEKLTGYAPQFSPDKILQDVIAEVREQGRRSICAIARQYRDTGPKRVKGCELVGPSWAFHPWSWVRMRLV